MSDYLQSQLSFSSYVSNSLSKSLLINVVANQALPIALANVGYKHYSLLICKNIVGVITVSFLFLEAKGESLEEIGRIPGKVIVQDLAPVQVMVESEAELKKKK